MNISAGDREHWQIHFLNHKSFDHEIESSN